MFNIFIINPYPAYIFIQKMSAFYAWQLDFIMEVNTMNPDQTALLRGDWFWSILFAI